MHYLFEITAKPGYTIEQYAEAWVRASELIQQAPGAQGTRLHRKIGDERTALAIATWESKACLLYTSPSPRDRQKSRMPSSA